MYILATDIHSITDGSPRYDDEWEADLLRRPGMGTFQEEFWVASEDSDCEYGPYTSESAAETVIRERQAEHEPNTLHVLVEIIPVNR